MEVPKDLSRTMKVIGAGYSRTGTLSMALALEKLLDGPVMHGGSQLLTREDSYLRLWSEILEARKRKDRPRMLKLLRQATAGFVAATDAPCNFFVEELLELYPDAEVMCVQRDRERWWKSAEAVTKTTSAKYLWWVLWPVPGKRWFPKLVSQYFEQQEEKWGPISANRLDEHNAYVKEVTPPEKFHMMELSEGWAPLCDVLKMPVPEEPFPRVNEAEAVDAVARKVIMEGLSRWMGLFGVAGLVGYGIWSASRAFMSS